jgi:hypothetical protein
MQAYMQAHMQAHMQAYMHTGQRQKLLKPDLLGKLRERGFKKKKDLAGTKADLARRLYLAMDPVEIIEAAVAATIVTASRRRETSAASRKHRRAASTTTDQPPSPSEAGESQTLITDVNQRPINFTDFISIFTIWKQSTNWKLDLD